LKNAVSYLYRLTIPFIGQHLPVKDYVNIHQRSCSK
jgi:hypothetical protein